MDWEAIGAIGEILGSIAVFITLVYLAMQIRQSTKAQAVATYEAAMSGFIATNSPISTDLQTASLWRRAIEDPTSLSQDEDVQFEFLVRNYTNNLYKVYRLYEQGAFPEAEWNTFASEAKQFFTAPITRQFRESNQLFSDLWADLDSRQSEYVSFLNRPDLTNES